MGGVLRAILSTLSRKISEESPGFFFFFHAECNIKIEVNKLKVQCGIDSLFPLAKSLFRFSEGYEFIDNYR